MNIEPHLHPQRVEVVRDRGSNGGAYVLYWMQAAQRTADNHALEYAIDQANKLGVAPLVLFCLVDGFPEANERHYRFMLEGLVDVQRNLADRGVRFLLSRGDPVSLVGTIARDAALVVTERAYLRVPKQWRTMIADTVSCTFLTVDTNLIVPVSVASNKREYAARTIRPKIRALFQEYCRPVPAITPRHSSPPVDPPMSKVSLEDLDTLIESLSIDRSTPAVSRYFHGGEAEASRRFKTFLSQKFFTYATLSSEPKAQAISTMSPYLHFGQISPVRLALDVWNVRRTDEPPARLSLDETGSDGDSGLAEHKRAYLEQLCVRRELAHNYVEYEPAYDTYDALPNWARTTLEAHSNDHRSATYNEETLDAAATDDPYWNAAMREMVKTGFMHNYLRMYWGKQIITWVPNPRAAFDIITRMNNRYFLDGRDPNSYTGIAWVFGLHDRPWPERPVFGTVRSMNANGLRRKFDIESYVRWVDDL